MSAPARGTRGTSASCRRSDRAQIFTISSAIVRVLCGLCALCVLSAACGNSTLFRQYEYDEEIYLSLDGSATVYVNGSLAALNALRGASSDSSPAARHGGLHRGADGSAVDPLHHAPAVRRDVSRRRRRVCRSDLVGDQEAG